LDKLKQGLSEEKRKGKGKKGEEKKKARQKREQIKWSKSKPFC